MAVKEVKESRCSSYYTVSNRQDGSGTQVGFNSLYRAAHWPNCSLMILWYSTSMRTLWLPAYPKSSFQTRCHAFNLVWESGHQTAC